MSGLNALTTWLYIVLLTGGLASTGFTLHTLPILLAFGLHRISMEGPPHPMMVQQCRIHSKGCCTLPACANVHAFNKKNVSL